jgi:hypothetical protein
VPVKSSPLLVKVPMVAMIVSLSELGPHHRGLDGDQQAEGRSTRTARGRSASEG